MVIGGLLADACDVDATAMHGGETRNRSAGLKCRLGHPGAECWVLTGRA